MSIVKIKDKTFKASISETAIHARVNEIAAQIDKDMAGKTPLFLAVLNGSFVFAADLLRELHIPCEISFVKMASYQGTSSMGKVKQLIGLNVPLAGRTVVIVEDIVDSGLTMQCMLECLDNYHPAEVRICTLLLKPGNLKVPLNLDYVAFRIPNDFIVGYGLDYDQQGRQLKDIYTLAD